MYIRLIRYFINQDTLYPHAVLILIDEFDFLKRKSGKTNAFTRSDYLVYYNTTSITVEEA